MKKIALMILAASVVSLTGCLALAARKVVRKVERISGKPIEAMIEEARMGVIDEKLRTGQFRDGKVKDLLIREKKAIIDILNEYFPNHLKGDYSRRGNFPANRSAIP